MLKVFASWGDKGGQNRQQHQIYSRIETKISDAKSVRSELVGPSRAITTGTFCVVVSEATVSIMIS